MSTAIVYDYIPSIGGGAERVLPELIEHFLPDVELFVGFVVSSPWSSAYIKQLQEKFPTIKIHLGPRTGVLGALNFRWYNYLLPALLESYDFSSFELVVSFTSFLSHTIIPPEHGHHILYLNTPARFLWNLDHAHSFLKKLAAPIFLTDFMKFRARLFDLQGITQIKHIYAISKATAERVKTFYNREAEVIYPPSVPNELVNRDCRMPALQRELGTYYMHISRIESYKNVQLLIELAAHHKVKETIVVVGNGPYLSTLKRLAMQTLGAQPQKTKIHSLPLECERIGTILFTGQVHEEAKLALLACASASFALNDEDFGITKVESLAVGTPVIGLKAGATPEVVKHGESGVLFEEPTPESLYAAIQLHEKLAYDRKALKVAAKQFSTFTFHAKLALALHHEGIC